MNFTSEDEAITKIYHSLRKHYGKQVGLDETIRDVTPTKRLLERLGLLSKKREYAVVTGSTGKGSTTTMTAKLLHTLGHNVGMLSTRYLVTQRERIRVNGRAIPESDFFRIVAAFSDDIDAEEARLTGKYCFHPQGIFLTVAMQWFEEQNVDVAVMEVDRGGRYDDTVVVPNKLALFSPITLEHTERLGATLDRIAWHSAGIIKDHGQVYSVAQPREVLSAIQKESDLKNAEFYWLGGMDMGEYLGNTEKGIRMRLGRYGELTVSLRGRRHVANATLAVQGAGYLHGLLGGIPHASDEYVRRVHSALATVDWPGRIIKLQENPTIFLHQATTVVSVQTMIDSLRDRLVQPVVSIAAIPSTSNYAGVYEVLGAVSDRLIITGSSGDPFVDFPGEHEAMPAAAAFNNAAVYTTSTRAAIDAALPFVGSDGTLIIVGSQPVTRETAMLWGRSWEVV